jgi:4-hydroxy-2-oxoheptanedioate aldolase
MIPIMLQQGYTALAVAFDVWGMANMVKDGMEEARTVIVKNVDEAAAAKANGSNGAAEVPTREAPSS